MRSYPPRLRRRVILPQDLLGVPYHGALVGEFMAQQGVRDPELEDLDGEFFVDAPTAGVCVNANSEGELVHTVTLYARGGEEGYDAYTGPLPHGLDLAAVRADVLSAFPRPPDLTSPIHDSWDHPEYRLVVQYGRDHRSIRAIALTTFR